MRTRTLRAVYPSLRPEPVRRPASYTRPVSLTPDDYIDLDEPHWPMPQRLVKDGEHVGWAEIPMTKRDWCATLTKWAGDAGKVDDALLERNGLSRAEFNEWRMDVAKMTSDLEKWRPLELGLYGPDADEP